jgi:hypothetical protein
MTTSRTLAVIGTAGRREDGDKLTIGHYRAMCAIVRQTIADQTITALASGGAAWADHTAVSVALEAEMAGQLTLFLPAAFLPSGFDTASRDGSTAAYYHKRFRDVTGVDYVADFLAAKAAGARIKVNPKGFLARNLEVAAAANVLLAFTFGAGPIWQPTVWASTATAREAGLKDGGTAHTFDRSRATQKIHVTLGPA